MMKHEMTSEEKHEWMTGEPIRTLIPRMAVPTVISMLVTSLYNMADTYFVSQISTSASAAVGINFSIMTLIQAIGLTLGIGSGSYISRMLGAKEEEKAEKACSTSLYLSLILGTVFAVAALLNVKELVRFLGATETIAPYAEDYAGWILLAAPCMAASFVLNNHLRAQGYALQSMIGITVGGFLNIILDPVLIFRFHMGISGAAAATVVSQIISFGLLLLMVLGTKGVIHPEIRFFTMKLWMFREIFHAGMPSLGRQSLAGIAMILLNVTASAYGDAAVAAMSIVTRVTMFLYSGLIGFGQGFQPVCGYNYGAERYDRVREAYYFCLKRAVIGMTVIGTFFFVSAVPLMTLFRAEDETVIRIGSSALRMECLALPFLAVVIMGNMLTQAIGYGVRATLIAVGRQGIFFIPAILILPGLMGIRGLQIAQAAADFGTFCMTAVILFFVMKEIKALEEKEKMKERTKKEEKK